MSGMTRECAIKTLKIIHCKGCNDYGDCETCYIDMAIADMEKQIPKKAINGEYPVCGELVERWDWKYCVKCGQAL